MALDNNKTALSLGLLFGLIHLIWVVIVAAGFGQALLDWKMGLHFVTAPQFTIGAFNLVGGLIGVVGAAAFGAIIGWLFAWIWNMLEK